MPKLKWRPNKVIVFRGLCVIGALTTLGLSLWWFMITRTDFSYPRINLMSNGYLVSSPSCHIPDLDPWHPSIAHLVKFSPPVVCSHLPPLTEVKGHTLSLLRDRVKYYTENLWCCWYEVTREDAQELDEGVDNIYNVSDCHPLNDSTDLTSEQQFILVKCFDQKGNAVYSNSHAVVPIRKNIQRKLKHTKPSKQRKMSVLIVAIDSVSRLNLMRSMPNTVAFLKKMNWVEMRGYNKVDDNTLPNLMAIMSGLNLTRIADMCMKTSFDPVEQCPLIWKNFSENGYVTAYGEDDTILTTFNYERTGFFKTPTDYYLRPFVLAAEHNTKVQTVHGMKACLGPTLAINHLYKYAVDFATTFSKNPFFGIFWLNTLSHEDVNTPTRMDQPTLKFFQDLTNNNILDDTLVIFISDHGMRTGDLRKSLVGWFEERLPFLFIWVPEWHRVLYPHKYKHLVENQNRLTSPYDLHLTLKEILSGESESGAPSCQSCTSLFNSVPFNRSCIEAGVTEHWCACSQYNHEEMEELTVKLLMDFTIHHLNSLLTEGKHLTRRGTRCATLKLNRVLAVRYKILPDKPGYKKYFLMFETLPGEGLFEATVAHFHQLELLGTVSRINRYGAQSECIKDALLRKYCYCLY